jgi:hypothetical protein
VFAILDDDYPGGWFYERCRYKDSRLLPQLVPDRPADLPELRADDRDRQERLAGDTRFVDFDHDGDFTVRRRTAERYDVQANTVYDRHLWAESNYLAGQTSLPIFTVGFFMITGSRLGEFAARQNSIDR